MSRYINTVTGPKRRRDPRGLSRHTLAAGIANQTRAMWRSETFGGLDSPWLPSIGSVTPEARLAYMITLADSYLRHVGDGWAVELDDSRHPHALVLKKRDDSGVLALEIAGRTIRVGRDAVTLTAERVGERVLELLAIRLAAFFGEVA